MWTTLGGNVGREDERDDCRTSRHQNLLQLGRSIRSECNSRGAANFDGSCLVDPGWYTNIEGKWFVGRYRGLYVVRERIIRVDIDIEVSSDAGQCCVDGQGPHVNLGQCLLVERRDESVRNELRESLRMVNRATPNRRGSIDNCQGYIGICVRVIRL